MPPQPSAPQRPNLDFIMNPAPPPKKSLVPTGNSALHRAIFVVIIVAVLLAAFIVISNLLSSGQKDERAALLKAAQEQTELARVAVLGNISGGQATKNLAVNTNLTLISDQKAMLNVLAAHGVKIKSKQLPLLLNQDTDKSLNDAKAAANFDGIFAQTLTEQLTAYEQSLKQAYDHSRNQQVRDNLDQNFTHADMLIQQAAGIRS